LSLCSRAPAKFPDANIARASVPRASASPPASFSEANSVDGYGIVDCDNGSNSFAISEDTPPQDIGSTCTTRPAGSNSAFVSFNEVGNTSTITFLGGAGAPSTFYFWTTDGNLTAIAHVTATALEPTTFLSCRNRPSGGSAAPSPRAPVVVFRGVC
jgi:hypothetical protein